MKTKAIETEYVCKCCEMQISYSTKVKASERISAKCSEELAKSFRNFYSPGTKAIAICHNHPSGSLSPSEDDKRSTRRLQEMCRVMQFKFIDHIILTADSYYSFNDNGNL